MMKIQEMKKRKKELGYTNAMVAELSGVPLGTVQKVFSGATANPRVDTLEALEMALKSPLPLEYSFEPDAYAAGLGKTQAEYDAASGLPGQGPSRFRVKKVDYWIADAPSERWPRQGSYTINDYFAVPNDIRIELIDGVIVERNTPTWKHQKILGELHVAFYRCIEEHGRDCEVLFAPFGVRIDRDDRTMLEPDLLVMYGPDGNNEGDYYDGAPDLVAEVLSPSTRLYDCTVKLRKYMNAGVREYWIIDPENEKVMVYVFEKDVLPTQYSFDDVIPVGISEGECSIDFSRIKAKLGRA